LKTITITIPVVVFILLMVLAIPLVAFYENMTGLTLESSQTGYNVTITFHYNVSVYMTNYRFAVYYNGTLLDEAIGERLSPGGSVSVSFNATKVKDLNKLTIEFSGKIGGLYPIDIKLHHK
jgi:archaellum component FlaF (FlaF/FlaG flagellin family)